MSGRDQLLLEWSLGQLAGGVIMLLGGVTLASGRDRFVTNHSMYRPQPQMDPNL